MNLKSAIESLFFIHGEPLALSKISKITGAPKKDVETALKALAGEYRERGVVLIENNGEWQFATNPENKNLVEKFISNRLAEELTRAGLEVLAIIAYKGPISRASIEYTRGVDSSFTVRNLLMRGLVERAQDPDDGRSFLYRVSTNFLKHLGLTTLEELPEYAQFRGAKIPLPDQPDEGSGHSLA